MSAARTALSQMSLEGQIVGNDTAAQGLIGINAQCQHLQDGRLQGGRGAAGPHMVVEVEAHEGLLAPPHQGGQVVQVAHRHAVEALEPQVVQVLVPQRGIARQHLRQHHYLHTIARGGIVGVAMAFCRMPGRWRPPHMLWPYHIQLLEPFADLETSGGPALQP